MISLVRLVQTGCNSVTLASITLGLLFVVTGIVASEEPNPLPTLVGEKVLELEPIVSLGVWKNNDRARKVLEPTRDFSKAEPFELMQGGAATQTTNVDRNAFSQESATLTFEKLQTFKLGNAKLAIPRVCSVCVAVLLVVPW